MWANIVTGIYCDFVDIRNLNQLCPLHHTHCSTFEAGSQYDVCPVLRCIALCQCYVVMLEKNWSVFERCVALCRVDTGRSQYYDTCNTTLDECHNVNRPLHMQSYVYLRN